MATNWPNSVQTFTNPSAGDSLNSPSHSAQHTTVNDTVEALQQYAGMVLVKTQTVGSGVSSVTVSNAFSSTFQNYKIIISGVDTTVSNYTVEFNFDGSTSAYYWAGWYRNYSNSIGGFIGGPNVSNWPVGYTTTSESTHCSFEVFHPFDSTRRAHYNAAPSAGNDFVISSGGQHANVSSFSGFRIALSAGTMTGGTIRVYGYNDG